MEIFKTQKYIFLCLGICIMIEKYILKDLTPLKKYLLSIEHNIKRKFIFGNREKTFKT